MPRFSAVHTTPEFRETSIDVFVGGPMDGVVQPTDPDRHEIQAVEQPEYKLTQDFDETMDSLTFKLHSYRRETMRSSDGKTISYVTFWISRDLTVEQALVKLCTAYKPVVRESCNT